MKSTQTSDPNKGIIVLNNGLRVVLENRPGRTVTSAFIVARVGSRHENETQAGYSHFVEHMLFKGTPKYSAKKISSEVEKFGGYLNASTSYEATNFYIRIPSISQHVAFKYLSEIFFHPTFPKAELEKERKVVIEEMHQREDDPHQKMYELGFRELFGKHPMGRPIIGYEDVIKTCSRESLMDYYHSRYIADNAVLSIAGGLWKKPHEKHDVIKQINDFFDQETAKNQVATAIKKVSVKQGLNVKHKKEGISQTYFLVALPGYVRSLYTGYELDVYQRIMGQGMSSRLFQKVREKLGLCYSIGCFNYPLLREGVFIVSGSSKENYEKAVDVTIKELKQSLTNITEKEVKDAKTGIIGQYYIDMDGVHFSADDNSTCMLDFNTVRDHEKSLNIIKNIKRDDVLNFMNNMWKDFNPSVVALS